MLGDEAHAVLDADHAGDACGDVFADAVAEHRRRLERRRSRAADKAGAPTRRSAGAPVPAPAVVAVSNPGEAAPDEAPGVRIARAIALPEPAAAADRNDTAEGAVRPAATRTQPTRPPRSRRK